MSPTTSGQTMKSSRSIQEFRLDFFLEEEFNVDPAFTTLFCQACGLADVRVSVERTVHSLSDKFGEADLVVVLDAAGPQGERQKLALLIENKINAGLQPDQAGRYRKRGEWGVENKLWSHYTTVLVAPKAYIDARPDAGFMAAVSIESLKSWITTADANRRNFKLARLDEAIAKKNATGVKVVDTDMTSFRKQYYRFLQDWNKRCGTAFILPVPKDTWWDDSWFQMKVAELPSWAQIRHLARTGLVSLDMRDAPFSKMEAVAELLDDDLKIIPSGKYKQHTSVQVRVPAISSFDDFERDRQKVEVALAVAMRLLTVFQMHRAKIENAYRSI
ncbi:hypothetical protein [Mesorhizobium sp. M0036]|uniref:hypothetical protein n=1 Tax=Mesorhizobium sp. M0036 TaxID=2956853 RepID=UPI00333D8809